MKQNTSQGSFQKVNLALLLFGFLLYLLFALSCTFAEATETKNNTKTVAVLIDGDSVYRDNHTLLTLIKQELRQRNTKNIQIVFRETSLYNADLDLAKAKNILKQVLQDSETDIILALGPLFTAAAAQPDLKLEKPVISTFVEYMDSMGLPHSVRGFSQKQNFTFIVTPLRMVEDITAFHKLIRFRKLFILIDKKTFEAFNGIRKEIGFFASQLGCELAIVTYQNSASDALNKLGKDVKALYLAPRLSLDETEWQKLIDKINARNIPTFSMNGYDDVYKGVLASFSPTVTQSIAQKTAFNLHEVAINGSKPENLNVYMPVEGRLLINALTAEQIGYRPSLRVLKEANFINAGKLKRTIGLIFVLLLLGGFLLGLGVKPAWRQFIRRINDSHEVGTERWLVNGECWEYTFELMPGGVKKMLSQHKSSECEIDMKG